MRARGTGTLLALLLLAGGCGGEGDRETEATRATTSAAPSGEAQYEGGEQSIEEFGKEASGDNRRDLLVAFRAYFNAVATEDYAAACSLLSARVHEALAQAVRHDARPIACATSLAAALSPSATSIARQQGKGRVAKVRIDGDRAFVVFHAPGADSYQLSLNREGNAWKATTVAASILVPLSSTLGQ